MSFNYTTAPQLEQVIEALVAAKGLETQALGIQQPEPPEPINEAALKVSLRNQVLAGSAVKAALFGTLSTEPTLDAAGLQNMGLTAAAAATAIAERDRLRAFFLALIG